jgi:hypothetical protein
LSQEGNCGGGVQKIPIQDAILADAIQSDFSALQQNGDRLQPLIGSFNERAGTQITRCRKLFWRMRVQIWLYVFCHVQAAFNF